MGESYILVLYYSRHGSVERMAREIAKGIESKGIEALIRTVSDDRNEGNYPVVSNDELLSASGIAMGAPCQFGLMPSPLKAFWETTSNNWLKGELIDKPACVFTSSSSLHGGNEATLLSMSLPLLHHGMMLMGIPYSQPELHTTTTGGTPYGASHVSGLNQSNILSEEEKSLCYALGQRLANCVSKLN